jgi:signal transduction histidine kinase
MASLGLLVAGIAHEIKNPLNFVNNFAELALELVEELRARRGARDADAADVEATLATVAENLGRIRQHGQRADAIINAMLMHVRDVRGEAVTVDFNELLVEYTTLAYHGFRASDVAFTAEIVQHLDPSLGPLTGPYQELARVIINLVSNACHAMRERQRLGDRRYRPTLRIESRRCADAVELTVADNGIGIAPEVRRRLFDPFFTTKPPGEGTGLGLSLSYEVVVNELGGAIEVASTAGEGATFTVRVPTVTDAGVEANS